MYVYDPKTLNGHSSQLQSHFVLEKTLGFAFAELLRRPRNILLSES